MTCVSSIAGVMNDHLCKTTDASLHAQNMVLYSFGVVINLAVFAVIKLSNPEGVPSFFTGYNSPGAISLIFLNASLGLIITAVYKCSSIVSIFSFSESSRLIWASAVYFRKFFLFSFIL